MARRSWPREKRKVAVRRNIIREAVQRRWFLLGEEVGARRSVRVPVARRARVEVRATMETCVAGLFDGGGPGERGG